METVCSECGGPALEPASCRETVEMKARILRVCPCELLVCDLCGCQEVLVHTDQACCFRVGQCVCITYNGAMTMSLPPQISADCVTLLNGCCC